MTDIRTDAEDIVDGDDTPSARLERQADAILEEGRAFGPRPLRRALREDAASARRWGRERAVRVRENLAAEPIKTTLWALGAGVLIGLLAAR